MTTTRIPSFSDILRITLASLTLLRTLVPRYRFANANATLKEALAFAIERHYELRIT
ncbi:hypothetical protein [uncultured Nostoc sp.]|uniref:hypothetical protein n=1 Tax=uncultured Nostoc sp. TaxID=340711 RepID=UPI0035CA31CA